MALEASRLEAELVRIFKDMEGAAANSPRDFYWYAREVAKAVTDQIKTAEVPSGSVIVAVSGGSGAPAVGAPNPAGIKVV